MEITIFKNILETKTPYIVDIYTIVDRIKTGGKTLDLINKIRSTSDKIERNKLKSNLPSICFSGKFSQRSNQHCISHSGLVCIDFDHVENLKDFKTHICKDKYTFLCFVSPSGDGLKVVVQIPANKDTHAASCKALKLYYNNDKLDSFEDIARVCYESYDPFIFFNESSEIFTELFTEPEYKKIVKDEIVKDDYEIFTKLKKWIEGQINYVDGNKHTFLVKFAGALNRYGINSFNSTSYLRNTYQNAAGHVNSKDFDDIVKRVYTKYSNQHSISYFDTKGISYEKTGKTYTPNDFLDEYQPSTKQETLDERFEVLIKRTYIDPDQPVQKQPIILSIRKDVFSLKEIKLFSLGNISAINGKAKSKKTFLNSMMAAALIARKPFQNLFIPDLPQGKEFVLYFDTEQSKYDSYNVSRRMIKLSKSDGNSFGMFQLRGTHPTEILEFLEYMINRLKNVGVIFVDQVADLAKTINDEEEANIVVRKLEKLTMDYNIHICCVIHQNKMNDMATGWLGSQIMKKAETIIKVTRDQADKSISIVEADLTRGEDFEPFAFKINAEGMPEILSSYSSIDSDFN